MNVSQPIGDKILARIQARSGTPVSTADLFDLGSPAAIKQALSRLSRAGKLLRVGRGLYAWPRVSPLLKEVVPPPIHQVVTAWARQSGLRIIPSGAHAANLLGVSTQVPAQYVYYTNGRTQKLVFDGKKVKLLNRGPRTMDVKGELPALIFQALKYLGKDRVGESVVSRMRQLVRPGDRRNIMSSLRLAPIWMRPILLEICSKGSD